MQLILFFDDFRLRFPFLFLVLHPIHWQSTLSKTWREVVDFSDQQRKYYLLVGSLWYVVSCNFISGFRTLTLTRPSFKPVMQKLVEKSRRILHAETAHAVYAGFPSPVTQPILPASFNHIHEIILQCAERVESRAVMQGMGFMTSSDLVTPFKTTSDPTAPSVQNTWLPDLYRFSSVGLSVEERYTFASAQPTPFIPSSPRVAEDKNFNFDHGALTTDLVEETSYMAWF